MAKAPLYNKQGSKVGDVQLNDTIFGIKVKPQVLGDVIISIQSNLRKTLAHAKGRSEVRGGGKKPWRQKGTGRARHGSSRSPIWIGGGITFGPTKERNFKRKINKQVKRQALFMSLSDKVSSNNFFILEDLQFEKPKTKQAAEIFSNLQLRKKSAKKSAAKKEDTTDNKAEKKKEDSQKKAKKEKLTSILVVLSPSNKGAQRAFRNLPKVDTMNFGNLNALDVVRNKSVVMSKSTVEKLEKVFTEKK